MGELRNTVDPNLLWGCAESERVAVPEDEVRIVACGVSVSAIATDAEDGEMSYPL